MKTFFIKSLLVGVFVFLILYKKHRFLHDFDITYVPNNYLSNSLSFNSKLEHLRNNNNFKNCTFLIAGSSMSLNNISGETIEKRTNEVVYNISSWALKPNQTLEFLKIINSQNQIKYLLIAFNNFDFGNNYFDIDFAHLSSFIYGSNISVLYLLLKKFDYATFVSNYDDRKTYSHINNAYPSLHFDKTGSILLERKGFLIDKTRWMQANDTTGFSIFLKNIVEINNYCIKRNINFVLIYLPTRFDLITPENRNQNIFISQTLTKELTSRFIDLNNLRIKNAFYCDGTHFFREGAELITNTILDSLKLN